MSQAAEDELTYDRWVPGLNGDHGSGVFHLRRYEEATRYAVGRRVLDAGCGAGYGAAMLAEVAARVVALDVSPAAVEYAKATHARPNLTFAVRDLAAEPADGGPFDLVASFEVLEHVHEPHAYLRNLAAALEPRGTLLLSTPNQDAAAHYDKFCGHYEPHVYMVNGRQLRRDLLAVFEEVEVLGMRRRSPSALHAWVRRLDVFNLRLRLFHPRRREKLRAAMGSSAEGELRTSDVLIEPGQLRQATTLFAICRRPRSQARSDS